MECYSEEIIKVLNKVIKRGFKKNKKALSYVKKEEI